MIITFVSASLACLLAAPLSQVEVSSQPPLPSRDTSAVKGTASIRGKVVTADSGRPIRRVQISVSAVELQGESRNVSTNAQGTFEVADLPAGRYTVTANRAGYIRLQFGQRRPGESGRPIQLSEGQRFTTADFALPRTAAMVGRITDEVGEPMPNTSIYPMQWKYFRGQRRLVPVSSGVSFNRTDDTGQYRITGLEPGDYYVLATTRDSWTDEKNAKEKIGFLPTYSGGTANPGEALRVRVGLGQEVLVPEFAMVPGRVGSISGTAVSSSGLPLAGETVNMSQEFSGPGASSSFGLPGTKVGADGSWTIRNVSPGEYKLSLRAAGDAQRPAEGASMIVSFVGDDLAGVTIVTTSGGTLRGRVITDTGEPLPRDARMRVSTRPVDPQRTYATFDQDNGRVRDDLTFEVKGVFGANRVNIGPAPTGWAVRSIEYEGKDLVDMPIELTGGQTIDGVTVILSKKLPKLAGTLLNERGQPAEGAVVMFPEDPARWSEESPLIRSARPDESGSFQFRNVVPGEYLLAPVEYVRENEWSDPAFLEGLKERAQRVRVDDAGAQPVALTLKKGS